MLSLVSKSTQAHPLTYLLERQFDLDQANAANVLSYQSPFYNYNKVLRAYIIEFNRCYYIPLTQATKNISFTGHRSVELMRELKQTTTTAKMRRKQHLATLAIGCDAICCDLIKLLKKSKNKPGNAQVTWQEGSLVKTRLTQISDSRVKSGNFPKQKHKKPPSKLEWRRGRSFLPSLTGNDVMWREALYL